MSRLPLKTTAGYAVPMSKDEFIRVRVDEKEKAELEKEAEADGRDLSNYIRRLINTHPDRVKRKKK